MAACFIAIDGVFLSFSQLFSSSSPSIPKESKAVSSSLIFFFFHLEFNVLITFPYPPVICCICSLMLNFRLLRRSGRENTHVRQWCSFCYDFIQDSIYFQPRGL